MNKKKKRVLYAVIIFAAIIIFVLYLIFLGYNERYDFIPFVIGSGAVLACYGVKFYGNKPIEWHGNVKEDEEQDSQTD